jgi:3-methylcrotonyl-CoA carboxylase beta subunit
MAGSIMYNQVKMSAEGIAQIALVHGPSTAGGAYIPALCDEVVIIRNQGAMFLGSPQLVFAATGEVVDIEPLGGAEMHSRLSGVTDHMAEDDAHASQITRNIVAHLGEAPRLRWTRTARGAPLRPARDATACQRTTRPPHRLPRDHRCAWSTAAASRSSSNCYGDTLICGFARIKGFEVGILANNGVLFSESAAKGAHFIELCCQRDIPLLFMADSPGFMVDSDQGDQRGIAKHGAKMITAMANADVPKYTLIIGGSYGAAYLAMCGRAFKPNALLMWPNARAAIMGPDQAATTLAMVKDDIHKRDGTSWTDEESARPTRRRCEQTFEDFANAYNFARNMWCDMVIDPAETRDVMALLLDLAGRVPAVPSRFGVFRM